MQKIQRVIVALGVMLAVVLGMLVNPIEVQAAVPPSVNYTLALNIENVNAYEADDTGEYYGSVQYRIDGKGDWIPFASNTDNNPWVVGRTGSMTERVGTKDLTLSESAKTINFQAKLYEYDPSVFDADEDLGYIEFAVPLPSGEWTQGTFGQIRQDKIAYAIKQGSSSTAEARWYANISRR